MTANTKEKDGEVVAHKLPEMAEQASELHHTRQEQQQNSARRSELYSLIGPRGDQAAIKEAPSKSTLKSYQGPVPTAKEERAKLALREEYDHTPRLTLEVLSARAMKIGTQYELNSRGFPQSKRKAADGYVYVGKRDEGVVNDIVIPEEEVSVEASQFVISYSQKINSYLVKDRSEGGTLLKVEGPQELRQGSTYVFGESMILVNILFKNKIEIRFTRGPNANQKVFVVS